MKAVVDEREREGVAVDHPRTREDVGPPRAAQAVLRRLDVAAAPRPRDLARWRAALLCAGGLAREIVALVRVTSAEGGTIEIALAASSGHRAYDRLALARAREAAATGAVADAMRKHRRTIWAFVTRFEIVPPVPGVGCGLDALLHLDLGRCVYPLKKLPPVSRVELRGVE